MAIGQSVTIVASTELLEGEVSTIAVSTSLVFTPDEISPQVTRAGYSAVVCGSVLAMLFRSAKQTDNLAS